MIKSLLRNLHKPIYDWRLKELVRLIGPHLNPGDRVLDVGCGFGQLGRALMDATFDAVILADVLHHDEDPDRLLRESARVSKRLVIIKDHLRVGFMAQQRISLLDWAANAGYAVPCLYRYNNLTEWRRSIGLVGSNLIQERTSVDIYPPVFNQLLGKGLHYFAVLDKAGFGEKRTPGMSTMTASVDFEHLS